MVKKNILFVDDEPLVLQGLQRMLRFMRAEWQMEFVEGGGKALERMAQQAFDVIVSDMRMPGMSGDQLLNQVMLRYPRTARLVLSGQADKDLVLKCVGSAHQYLIKPCDPDALRAGVNRAVSVGSLLADGKVQQLVGRMDHLPSVPSVYTEIVKLLQDPDATIEEVGKIISRDIAMAANILKLVNSAFFGGSRPIATPSEAAACLGLETIRSLVLCINAFSQFEGAELRNFSLEALSSHCLETAAAAKAVARAETTEPRRLDEAFTGGLLHDIGKLVLAVNFPELFRKAVEKSAREQLEFCRVEKEFFGATHADVGGYLLGLWGLPAAVVDAIALHHTPSQAKDTAFSALTAVHVANVIVNRRSHQNGLPMTGLDEQYLDSLRLKHRLPAWEAACAECFLKGATS